MWQGEHTHMNRIIVDLGRSFTGLDIILTYDPSNEKINNKLLRSRKTGDK